MNTSSYLAIDYPNIPVIAPEVDKNECDFMSVSQAVPEILEPCVGSIRIKDMYHSNFSLREYKGHFNRHALLVNESGIALDYVCICLFLAGEVQTFWSNGEEMDNRSFKGSQNCKYDPGNDAQHIVPANKPFHIAHFSIKTDFFNQLLPQNENWADQLRASVQNKERFIGKKFRPMLAAQMSALQNIYDCPLTGKLGDMMVETSFVQIILLHMHSLFDQEEMQPKISNHDIDMIHAVKDHITQHFLDDHSISNLSKQFGTNKNKLMTLFRQQFGKSIFDYLTDERMTYAREILRQGNVTVADVAYALGYKNANHFSTAFKRKYAMSPSQIRK